MGTVFGKNTTSSSITVAGHKVYYIDSTDAEIVEVEGTSGQALPSVGDTVIFGNYPQATSTPEPIEWTVLAVDSANGKALLIAKKVLDCQKYNSVSASVTWETCSLRTWLNSTFFNAAFDATEQGRIPLSHIETAGGNATDDNVFCMSDQEVTNTAYFADADARKALGTQKAIDAGVFTNENGYSVWWLRTAGSSFYFANYVYYDGGVQEYGVNATGFGVRPALWLNFASSVKYNAFKYLLSGTPYWYVIDGEHDTWTDDLSAWGYSEMPVGPVLPEVKQVKASGNGWGYLVSNLSDTSVSIANNEKASLYFTANTNVWGSSSLPYSVGMLQSPSGTDIGTQGVIIDTSENVVKCKNVSGSSLSITRMTVYYCNDATATVVPVYNSSNVAYNAFKYTTNGTDYYYVLDGTQTDWTDDLASIGYRDYIEATYYYYDKSYTNVSNNSWVYLYDNGTTTIPVDDVSKYEFVKYYTGSTDTKGRDYGITLSVSNGKLTAINTSGATIVLQRVDVRIHS